MNKTRMASVGLAFLLLAGVGAAVLGLRRDRDAGASPQSGPAATPVSATSIRRGAYSVDLESIGAVQPLNSVSVRSRVEGQIVAIDFKQGQAVKAGDLLIKLDDRTYKAALDQALAKKAQDQATLANARLDLERYRKLARNAFATEQQLDTQKATVASGEAQAQADEAAIETARAMLGYTEIRAPIAGRIGFRLVDVGNIVQAGGQQALLSIVEVDPINVLFTVPEDRISELREAMGRGALPTRVYTSDGKTELAAGKLQAINNQVDAASGAVQAKAVFENGRERLWPGQSVVARLHVRDVAEALIAPQKALQRGPDGLYVWRIGPDDVAHMQAVEVSMQDHGQALVASGLKAGDRVVTDGQYRLFDGARVKVTASADERQASAR